MANRQGDKPVPEVCKLHPGKLCDLFCSDCKELLCSTCISINHKYHAWTPFEDVFQIKVRELKSHMTAISAKIKRFKNMTSERHRVKEVLDNHIEAMRKDVNKQRTKLKTEVDSVAEAVLTDLSSLQNEELANHNEDCELYNNNVTELERLLKNAEMTRTSSISVFEIESSLEKSISLYDENARCVFPKQADIVTERINRAELTKLIGKLKIVIDSRHIQRLSMFTVAQQSEIIGLCPVDDSHAWLSVRRYKDLLLVNREGVVTRTIKCMLDLYPQGVVVVGTSSILMTSQNGGRFVYQLSLNNDQTTKFADIGPNTSTRDISIDKKGEVFVSTSSDIIVVLNLSGSIVRKVTCGMNVEFIACLSSGNVAVMDRFQMSIIDESGTVQHTWTGQFDNGGTVSSMNLGKMARDKYDRLFVPNTGNSQVYVLQRDSTQASCLLDRNHGVVKPTAVGVDTCGNVWVGCNNGTVLVMRL